MSVPYALYAEKSGNVSFTDTSAVNELQVISISNDTIYLSNGGFVVLPPDQTVDADADSTNELQTLSFANDTLILSNGNAVILPKVSETIVYSYGNFSQVSPVIGTWYEMDTSFRLTIPENGNYNLETEFHTYVGNAVNFTLVVEIYNFTTGSSVLKRIGFYSNASSHDYLVPIHITRYDVPLTAGDQIGIRIGGSTYMSGGASASDIGIKNAFAGGRKYIRAVKR